MSEDGKARSSWCEGREPVKFPWCEGMRVNRRYIYFNNLIIYIYGVDGQQ